MKKKVTLSDIATLCNVTKGAVSRALANKYNISDEKAYEIKQKAIELGYDFSKLKFNKNDDIKILILCPARLFFKEHFWQTIIKSISSSLSNKNVKVDYFIFDENDLKSESLSTLSKKIYQGFIVVHYNTKDIMDLLYKQGLPTVVIDPKFYERDFTKIEFSNTNSIYNATQYLIDLGHKNILFYGSDSHSISFKDRHNGFLLCLNENPNVKGYDVIFDNSNKSYSNPELLTNAINSYHPTAIICANDIIALNAYEVIKSLGLSIPEDISVIGFDNVDISSTSIPKLSTFDIPLQRIGKAAADYLFSVIKNDAINYSQIVIKCDFINRDSVKERK